ncbi:MAG TPA: hypothetical protein VHD36_12410 [Pirellulales bacterium]|nr:hypothetical protein [Pirellulales bacterium]
MTTKPDTTSQVFGVLFVAVFLAGYLWVNTGSPAPSQRFVGRGERVTVRNALVAVDYETWKEMDKLQSIGDTAGLNQLTDAKLITRAGGTVLVIDPGFCCARVRFLDGPMQGAAGYLSVAYLSR